MALLALLIGLGGGLADQPPPPPRIPVITSVQWDQRPSAEAVRAAYPALALILGINGVARVNCTAMTDGSVRNCQATATPSGWGFEASAVRLVESGRVLPQTVNGVASEAPLTTRVPFYVDDTLIGETYRGREPDPDDLAYIRAIVAWGAAAEEILGADDDALTEAERAAVMPVLRRAFEEYRAEWVDAVALGVARLMPPGIARAARNGERPPPPPYSEAEDAAFDQARAVEARIFARTRVLYCAQFDCPPP